MGKPLSEMTLEELWQLFPIILTAHDARWQAWYSEERDRLLGVISVPGMALHHVGSTAIGGIWAKPIVDILMEIPASASMEEVCEMLTQNGYLLMSGQPGRMSFNRGYTSDGFAERVFHLHLRYAGDRDEVFFRDYMNAHPALAREYEALKLSLWKQYEHDRDGYTAAKGAFVAEHTRRAKEEARKTDDR